MRGELPIYSCIIIVGEDFPFFYLFFFLIKQTYITLSSLCESGSISEIMYAQLSALQYRLEKSISV